MNPVLGVASDQPDELRTALSGPSSAGRRAASAHTERGAASHHMHTRHAEPPPRYRTLGQ